MNNKNSRLPIIPGVSNYDKLKNLKKSSSKIHHFNPFSTQVHSSAVKNSREADSLDAKYIDDEIYYQLLMMQGHGNHRNVSKTSSYYSLDRKARRNKMIRMSSYDIVDEVLQKLTDELIVTSKDKLPIELIIDVSKLEKNKIQKDFIKELKIYANKEFKRIYKLYGFGNQGTKDSLWSKTYLFLVEGSQAYELIWDDIKNPKKIIGIQEIDSLETEEFYIQGIKHWKHHKTLGVRQDYIIMFDSQISYIDWSLSSPNNKMSYLESLLKSFNDLRIIDESLINWTITNSIYRLIFKIPTKGKSRIASAQALATEKNRYNDDIEYNGDTGELSINGRAKMMMQKSYWMNEGDAGTPSIDTVGSDGHDLSNIERNEYFSKKFYRAAKMPYSRFDSSASETWNMDTRSQLREEITFGRFTGRIQSMLKMLMLKPLYLQLIARFPEIQNDTEILDAIGVRFNSYSVFEELMHLDIMQEKIEAVSKLNEAFVQQTPDGDEIKFFSLEWLIKEYIPELTDDKLELNSKMSAIERERMFKQQLKQYQLKGKYDPDRNIDMETGKISDELFDKIEKELNNEIDTADDEKQSIEDELYDEEIDEQLIIEEQNNIDDEFITE